MSLSDKKKLEGRERREEMGKKEGGGRNREEERKMDHDVIALFVQEYIF